MHRRVLLLGGLIVLALLTISALAILRPGTTPAAVAESAAVSYPATDAAPASPIHLPTGTPLSDVPVNTDLIPDTATPIPASPVTAAGAQMSVLTADTLQLPVPAQPVANQLVITFHPRTSPQQRQDYLQIIGATVVQRVDALDTVVVSLPAPIAAQPLPASSAVAASEPDYFVVALEAPVNDALYEQQWALPVIAAPDGWAVLPTDSPAVTVAVVDSGVCANHPDLIGRVLPGYDFVDADDTPEDTFGHGCGVAGVIAASGNNGIGITGVAPNARILPVRVLNGQGIGTYSAVAAGIVYAADHGARIINLSLGGANPSSVLQNAVDYALSKGALVVAAAGNNGGAVLYPAAYAPVIAVASVDPTLQRSSFSSYGPEVDLLAPGRDILTTSADGGYRAMTGTSFAAPQVAGVAALEIGLGRTLALTGGLLRFSGSLTPPPPPTPDGSATPPPPQPVNQPSMRNPAAVYCLDLGHQYEVVPASGGDDGVCILPGGERCPQWDFYAGTCGQQDNYCAGQGLNTVTMDDGRDPFSPRYAACADSNGQIIGSVSELSSLASRATGCTGGACPQIAAEDMGNIVHPAEDWVSSLAVPSSLDWRSYRGGNWLTGIRSQGGCGSCWAFAAVGAAEASMKIGAVNLSWQPDLSEQQLVSTCDSSYWRGSCGGGSSTSALDYIRDIGIVDEACMVYNATDAVCSTRCSNWASRLTTIDSTGSAWYWDSGFNAQYIKQNLVARGPVVVYMGAGGGAGTYWTDDIFRCTNDRGSNGSTYTDHAVVAVGYNDAGGYWIIRNSWGTWFGEGGYFKVGYNECNIDSTGVAFSQQLIPAPVPQSPAANTTVFDKQVSFSWQGSGTPLQNAYDFRINTSSNPNSGTMLVNTTLTSASYSHTFATGGTYYWHIRTATDGGSSSGWVTSKITVDVTPPPNDNFASFRTISALPYTDTSIKTRWATLQTGEKNASCSVNDGKSVWYRYTPAITDTVIFKTQNSDYDTVLSVWTGSSLTNLNEIACNDQFYGDQSEISFLANAGTPYYIRVSGWNSSYGSLTLTGGSASVQTAAELVAAINAANAAGSGDIHLVPGRVYTLTGIGGDFGLPPVISGTTITIYGHGATIRRDPNAPTFRLLGVSMGGTLTLYDLTLSGGRASNGGAIYNSGTLNLNSVTLSQNHADNVGGALYNVETVTGWDVHFLDNHADFSGGGLYMWDSGASAYFSYSEFRGNSAGDGGGAVKLDAETLFTLYKGTIRDNQAVHGGGLVNEGTAYVTATTIMGNHAVQEGGGGINSGTLTLRDSFVRVNNASYGGGLVNWVGAVIERTTFSDNIARSDGGSGGALYNYGTMTLVDSILNNNQAIQGGALMNYMGDVTVHTSHFLYNHATWGGAINSNIALSGIGAQTYEAIGPDGQAAPPDSAPQPPAGTDTGMGAASTNQVQLADVKIGHNSASYGGGLYNYSGTLTAENLDVHNNSAAYNGGGLYNLWNGTLSLAYSRFTQNYAVFDGGGGANEGVLTISDSRFEENATGLYHGGGLVSYGQLTATQTDFIRNHAEGSGGAVFSSGLASLRGFYLQNSAYYDGGAVMNYGQMTLGGQLGSNRTGYNGGAIASAGGGLTLEYGTLVEYNEASALGGGLYYQATSDASSLTFDGPYPDYERRTIFYLNSARQGGGLYLKRSTDNPLPVWFDTITLNGNEADGGAVVSEIPLSITQSCISANQPTSVVSGAGAVINADGNWWGMANGPSGAGPGLGDSVSDSVTYNGFLTVQPEGCSPSNDNVQTGVTIADLPFVFTQVIGNASPAASDPELSACVSQSALPYPFYGLDSVWYRYTAPRDGELRLDTSGSAYDTMLSVWAGGAQQLSYVTCNDDAPGLGTASQVQFNVTGGTDYHLLVIEVPKSGSPPEKSLQLNAVLLPPPNDDFAQAINITSPPLTDYANTIEASAEPSDPVPSCIGSLGRTVWYRYASPDGSSLRFSTADSEYPAALSVWRELSGGGLEEAACDSSTGIIDMQAVPGAVYYIMVGDTGVGGSLVFTMPLPLRVPVLTTPGDGAAIADTRPAFSWSPVTGAAGYEVNLGTSPTFTRAPDSVTHNSYRPPLPLMTTLYYWQVRSVGTQGSASAWSDVYTVNIVSPASAAPGRNLSTTPAPRLAWGNVTYATQYEVQVSTSSTFAGTPVFAALLNANQFEVLTDPLPDGTYFWRVRAKAANGQWSGWSAVDSFTIDVP